MGNETEVECRVEEDTAWAFSLPLPFAFVAAGDASVREEFRTLESNESGRKTAAQRSYSWQSKKDLASRYLLSSLASSAASSGSLFGVLMGEVKPVSPMSSPSVSGSALSSSAALRDWDQHFWELGRVIES